LGELDAEGRAKATALARQMMGRAEQRELFEAPPVPTEIVSVRLDQVRMERGRRFGDVWMGLMLWRALRLDDLCWGEAERPCHGRRWWRFRCWAGCASHRAT
jgi:hypothetical protein